MLRVLIAVPLLLGFGMAAYGYLGRDTKALEEERRLSAPLREGIAAPVFSFPDLEGRSVSLSDFRAKKVVLVNIWATWCPSCEWEKSRMERLYRSMRGKDFEILAVSIDALGKDVVIPYVERLGVSYRTLLDPKGEIKRLYRITGVPESFLIDKNGRLIRKIIGPLDWSRAEVRMFMTKLARTPTETENVVRGIDLEGDRSRHYGRPSQ